MPSDNSDTIVESRGSVFTLCVGFGLLLAAGVITIWLTAIQRDAALASRRSREFESQLYALSALLADAETGQRGYLLTGRLDYLEPFETARRQADQLFDNLAGMQPDGFDEEHSVRHLRQLWQSKLDELKTTIDMRAANDSASAIGIVDSDRGKKIMDDIRRLTGDLHRMADAAVAQRAARTAWLNDIREIFLFASVFLILVLGIFSLRDTRRRVQSLRKAQRDLHVEENSRKEAELQVRQLQKMEAVGQLTGGIAHDFNNMLGVIVSSLDVARQKISGTENQPVLKLIDSALEDANRAAALTSRLLAFSRQQSLSPQMVDPNELIRGMSDLIRRSLGELVDVEIVLAGGIWRVFTDRVQVESSLLNLIVNARDAMPSGGKLTIETSNADLDDRYALENADVSPGQYVLISVTDTGIGMSAEVQSRAFDPFFTTKEVGKGTGLGLSQVFGFVKQSGGHVKIYSEPQSGTSIKIYLKRYMRDEPDATQLAAIQRTRAGGGGQVVLVVEDEASLRTVTCEALEFLGYHTLATGSPLQAIDIARTRADIALLFTDIVMPELTGRQLADRIREFRPELPVLFTTGYTRNAVVHNGVVDPGVVLLQKPYTVDQLAEKVTQLLATRSAHNGR